MASHSTDYVDPEKAEAKVLGGGKADVGVSVRGLDTDAPEGAVHRTGLFVGAGGALASGGPLGLWLGYTIMGLTVGTMMLALGEMTTLYPVSGAFVHYTARFLDPALGFALGSAAQGTTITAAALLINYWRDDINVAVWITSEFSILKILTIIGLILVGIIITAGGVPGQEAIGFRYWHDPEIVALTAGEAENPRRNVPKAIRRVFFRIVAFYFIGTFVIGLIVSPNDPNLTNGDGVNASPWVIAIQNAGISALPSIVNAAVLLSAFSAGNSDLYASSRTLYGLALDGKAPKIFRKCTKAGLPIYCVGATALFGVLAYMNVGTGATQAFNYLSALSSVTGLITWACINLSYLRFYYGCRAHGIDRNEFPYKAPFQPYASYFGLVLFILVIFFNGYQVFLDGQWDTGTFLTAYIPVWVFIILAVFWKFYKKTTWVRIANMDFETGRRELDAIAEEEAAKYKAPTTWYAKVWDWIM
ncbi:hypothetical protein Rhopal_005827-T1 [Rhodotorula paludigena]|uniref:Amino acid permease/ SLC12A domain-containing protein n=2 Tax=Rhodotorula paludigena TaxID=86838 RepID=A0AAV5GS66_9BASI|nr:hypothetical protein Rhopal_005827-T1 [Rhodotorula paludigena]